VLSSRDAKQSAQIVPELGAKWSFHPAVAE